MPANVRDIDAIRRIRASLITFAEEAETALQLMLMEAQKTIGWIEQDRPHYWKIQTRKAFDLVASTRTNYETCRMRTVAGHRSSCIEEKQAFEKAKRRLLHCQEQIERVRKWANTIRHETDEFRGRLSGLQTLLSSDIPKAIALLEKTATVLESYAEISRPDTNESN